MEEVEKFSFKKLAMSPLDPMWWVKGISLMGPQVLIYIIIAVVAYNMFFKKDEAQVNKVRVESGGTANFITKTKRALIPFIEGFSELNSGSDGFEYGARAGIRWEF